MQQIENILISIIVPVYKTEKYISRCLESILNQHYSNIEIILVDDGSPDKSLDICNRYKKRDGRIKVIHQENMGPMAAIANGIKECYGKYIGFVDSDDWIEPNMYKDMLNIAEENHADLVQCGIMHDSKTKSTEYLGIDNCEIFDGIKIQEELLKKLLNFWETKGLYFPPSRCNKLIRKDLLESNIRYCDLSLKMGEDLNMILPILIDCQRIICLNSSYYHYVENLNSTTKSYNDNLWYKNKQLFKAINNICMEKNIDFNFHTYIRKYYNFMAVLAIFNENKSKDKFRIKKLKMVTICKENPAKKYLKEYYSKDFSFLKRIIILLMITKLYYFIPIIFRIREKIKKMIYNNG